MLPTLPCLPDFARPATGVLLVVLLLGGCESVPSLEDIDPAPPTMSTPSPEEPSEPVPRPKLVTVLAEPTPAPAPSAAPVATNEQSTWSSVSGPIFNWLAESGTRPATNVAPASTTVPAAVSTAPPVATTVPETPPATNAAEPAARASSLILTLTPRLPPSPQPAAVAAPPASQTSVTAAAAVPQPATPPTQAASSPATTVRTPAAPKTVAASPPPPAVTALPGAAAQPPEWQTNAGPIFDWARSAEPVIEAAPEPVPLSAWQLREQQMRGLPGWQLNGRVAISSPQESWSAVLRWEQVGDAFHVRLSTPLGQGLVDLRGVPGEVLLRTAEGAVYRAPDAETLLRDVAGMNLPVSGLRYWVLAVTDPTAAAGTVDLDSDSLPLVLEQSGWRIEYDRYRDTGGGRLPDRLTFEGKDLDGRLIVTQWDVRES